MSRATATAGLFRQILKRMPGQQSLEQATDKVSQRTGKSLIEPEAAPPEELPLGVDPDAPALDPELNPSGQVVTDEPKELDTGALFSRDETKAVTDALGDPDVEILSNMNYARIDTEEDIVDVLEAIHRVKEGRGEGLKGPRSFKAIEEDSKSVRWETVVEKWRNKEPLQDAEIRKAREVEVSLLGAVRKRGFELLEMQRNGQLTDEMEFEYRTALTKAAAVSQFVGNEKRRLAQSLAALRDTVSDNQYIKNLQRDRYLELMAPQAPFKNVLERITATNTPKQIRDAMNDSGLKRIMRFAGNVWYNAVLSKFAVAKAALGGVVVNKFVYPMETGLAYMFSQARRVLGADMASQPAINRAVTGGEFLIELSGIFQGLRDAVGPIIRHLQDPTYDLGPSKFEHRPGSDTTLHGNFGGKGKARDAVYQVIDAAFQNGSFRLMKMGDFAARSVSFQQRVKSLAYRVAVNEGKGGDELLSRMNELMREMPDEIFQEAHHAGGVATMTQNLLPKLQKIEKGLFRNIPGLRFFAPFSRTMFAMLQASVERLPILSFLSSETRAAWAKGGAARDMVLGKQSLGLGLLGMGAFMAHSGEATSGAYLSDHERRSLFKSGWRPNSLVDSKGSYWSMQFASPAAEIFFLGVALYEMSKYINAGVAPDDPRYRDWDEVLFDVTMGASWMFVDINLNRAVGAGVLELFQAIEDPGRYGKDKVTRVATPFFQFAGGDLISRAIDPTRRRIPEGNPWQELIDNITKSMPGLSDDLPPAIGWFGEERPGYSMLDVFSYSPQDPNAGLWRELFNNGITTNYPNRMMHIAGAEVNLDTDIRPEHFKDSVLEKNPEARKRGYAYYRFSQIRGQRYKDLLERLVRSAPYKSSRVPYGEPTNQDNAITKGDLIQSVLREANAMARAEFQKELKRDLKAMNDITAEIRASRKPATGKFMPPGVDKATEQQDTERLERNKQRREKLTF